MQRNKKKHAYNFGSCYKNPAAQHMFPFRRPCTKIWTFCGENAASERGAHEDLQEKPTKSALKDPHEVD